MIICSCAQANTKEVQEKATILLKHATRPVGVEHVIALHKVLEKGKPQCKGRCGQCLPAVATILKEETEKVGDTFECDALNRDNLIQRFKQL